MAIVAHRQPINVTTESLICIRKLKYVLRRMLKIMEEFCDCSMKPRLTGGTEIRKTSIEVVILLEKTRNQ